jgi:type III pantothenate kinase
MILCDIGNTTFSFFDLTKNKKFKVAISTKKKQFPKLKTPIYFISVNDKDTKNLLKYYPNSINCAKFINFKTPYKGMGIDRIVACSGIKNGIVVDVGSAITVDIMKDNHHKGGFILAGINNLTLFYPQISSKLEFKLLSNINLDKLPLNTNEAISYAIFKSIILPIKECEQKYNLPLYFTGGDSKLLIKYFKNAFYKKYLIFNNLKNIIVE